MRIWLVIALVVAAVMVVSCGGYKPSPGNELELPEAEVNEESYPTPEWFQNPPQDSIYQYERAEAIEQTMSMAERIARQDASAALARWIKVEVDETFGQSGVRYGERGEQHYSWERVVEEVTSEVLKGVEPSPGHLDIRVQPDGKYHVYLLVRMPRDQASVAVTGVLSKEEELYEQFIRDGLVKRFETRIKEYKQEKLGKN